MRMKTGRRQALADLAGQLDFPAADLRAMMAAFHEDMDRGLSGGPSSLKMLPTFADNPSGREKGEALALDLGGTNFRVLWVRLAGDGRAPETAGGVYKLERGQVSTTGEALFGAIARIIREFLAAHHLHGAYPLGFTFSFPVRQHSIRRGDLIVWTKGWTASGVEGRDVAALLDRALEREGVSGVRVASLGNDTTGTEVARAYIDPACDAGCILGTGTNICYRERADRIRGPLDGYDREFMIVNMESGNFNRALPRGRYDAALDVRSENPGAQWEEKMVSGKYLGELVRLAVVDWTGRGLLFGSRLPPPFSAPERWTSEMISLLLAAPPSAASGLLAGLGAVEIDAEDAAAVREIGRMFVRRAARVAAGALAAAVTRHDPELERFHTAAIDGSIFEKMPGFPESMRAAFDELFGARAERIRLALTHDGSGLGAAIIAASSISFCSDRRARNKNIS
jgi:hexokinase